MNATALLQVWLATALTLAVLQAVTYAIGRRIGRYNVVDVVWGLGFAAVALVAALVGDGSLARRILLLVLVTAWGLRLSVYIGRRTAGHGEDPRYTDLLDRRGRTPGAVITRIFLTQGVSQWIISMPIQISAVAGPVRSPAWVVVVAGALVWAVGLLFEAVGDRQLARFKADPGNRGQIMDCGLWAWTRHPNYFGDFCVWWGIWLIAASSWPGILTVFAPLIMSYLLIRGTGAVLLEKTMQDRPGYREYQRRTASFFPRPPRAGQGSS
jgi:steroid 5-alpha reductase family enzyme